MFKQNRSSILKHDKMTASYLISKSNRISTNKAHKDTMMKILKHKRNMKVEEKYIKKKMKGRKLNEDPSIGTKVDKNQTISKIDKKEMIETIEIMLIMIDKLTDMTTEKVETMIEIEEKKETIEKEMIINIIVETAEVRDLKKM